MNISNLVLTFCNTEQFKCRENVTVTRRDIFPKDFLSREKDDSRMIH